MSVLTNYPGDDLDYGYGLANHYRWTVKTEKSSPCKKVSSSDYWLYEKDDKYIVRMDVPGIKKENIKIEVEPARNYSTLEISVPRLSEERLGKPICSGTITNNAKYFLSFENVDHSNIESTLEDGVLTITLKKKTINSEKFSVPIK